MKQVYLSWCQYIRRPDSMRGYIPFRLYFIHLDVPRSLKLLAYLYCGTVSFAILVIKRPDVVWVQLAPTPILYIAFIYKFIFKRRALIIADCHNSAFRRPFINMPFAVRLMNKCDLLLAHNTEITLRLPACGLTGSNIAVLSSPPARVAESELRVETGDSGQARNYLIFPCAYDPDEPLVELIRAMEKCPDFDLYLTGNRKKAATRLANHVIPANVKFTGFLPVEELDSLIDKAFAVVALTTSDDTMLSSAAEGIGHGRPLLLSDRKAVRELYDKGRVLVEPTSSVSIAEGISRLKSDYSGLISEANELRASLQSLWHQRASAIFAKLPCPGEILSSKFPAAVVKSEYGRNKSGNPAAENSP